MLKQKRQYAEWLFLQGNTVPKFAELAQLGIKFEWSKPVNRLWPWVGERGQTMILKVGDYHVPSNLSLN
jgi:hypothetical protein